MACPPPPAERAARDDACSRWRSVTRLRQRIMQATCQWGACQQSQQSVSWRRQPAVDGRERGGAPRAASGGALSSRAGAAVPASGAGGAGAGPSMFVRQRAKPEPGTSALRMPLDELPPWRAQGDANTSARIRQIAELSCRLRTLYASGDHRVARVVESFKRNEVVRFVLTSNLLESEGTSTLEDTVAALEGVVNDGVSPSDVTTTKNTLAGMQLLASSRKAVPTGLDDHVWAQATLARAHVNAAVLTTQMLCDTHAKVVHGLHSTAGSLREVAVASWDGHMCMEPGRVPSALRAATDTYWAALCRVQPARDACEATAGNIERMLHRLFRLAAWAWFTVVDIHPFAEGNGRVSRLVASHVLSVAMPFPVGLGCGSAAADVDTEAPRRWRLEYLLSIKAARGTPGRHASRMCALLVDGALAAWQRLFATLEQYKYLPGQVANLGRLQLCAANGAECQDCLNALVEGYKTDVPHDTVRNPARERDGSVVATEADCLRTQASSVWQGLEPGSEEHLLLEVDAAQVVIAVKHTPCVRVATRLHTARLAGLG